MEGSDEPSGRRDSQPSLRNAAQCLREVANHILAELKRKLHEVEHFVSLRSAALDQSLPGSGSDRVYGHSLTEVHGLDNGSRPRSLTSIRSASNATYSPASQPESVSDPVLEAELQALADFTFNFNMSDIRVGSLASLTPSRSAPQPSPSPSVSVAIDSSMVGNQLELPDPGEDEESAHDMTEDDNEENAESTEDETDDGDESQMADDSDDLLENYELASDDNSDHYDDSDREAQGTSHFMMHHGVSIRRYGNHRKWMDFLNLEMNWKAHENVARQFEIAIKACRELAAYANELFNLVSQASSSVSKEVGAAPTTWTETEIHLGQQILLAYQALTKMQLVNKKVIRELQAVNHAPNLISHLDFDIQSVKGINVRETIQALETALANHQQSIRPSKVEPSSRTQTIRRRSNHSLTDTSSNQLLVSTNTTENDSTDVRETLLQVLACICRRKPSTSKVKNEERSNWNGSGASFVSSISTVPAAASLISRSTVAKTPSEDDDIHEMHGCTKLVVYLDGTGQRLGDAINQIRETFESTTVEVIRQSRRCPMSSILLWPTQYLNPSKLLSCCCVLTRGCRCTKRLAHKLRSLNGNFSEPHSPTSHEALECLIRPSLSRARYLSFAALTFLVMALSLAFPNLSQLDIEGLHGHGINVTLAKEVPGRSPTAIHTTIEDTKPKSCSTSPRHPRLPGSRRFQATWSKFAPRWLSFHVTGNGLPSGRIKDAKCVDQGSQRAWPGGASSGSRISDSLPLGRAIEDLLLRVLVFLFTFTLGPLMFVSVNRSHVISRGMLCIEHSLDSPAEKLLSIVHQALSLRNSTSSRTRSQVDDNPRSNDSRKFTTYPTKQLCISPDSLGAQVAEALYLERIERSDLNSRTELQCMTGQHSDLWFPERCGICLAPIRWPHHRTAKLREQVSHPSSVPLSSDDVSLLDDDGSEIPLPLLDSYGGNCSGHLNSMLCAALESAALADEAPMRPSCSGRHIFHRSCLTSWLARKSVCPLDNTVVKTAAIAANSVTLLSARLESYERRFKSPVAPGRVSAPSQC